MKKLLQCILFFMIICSAQAQQLSNQKYFVEELLVDNNTNDEISSAINTVETTFVLDSSRRVSYKSNHNDTIRYYYKYDSNKNIIEETTYTTIKEGHDASGISNTKYEYFYNENNKKIVSITYQLNLETYQWYIIGKGEIDYSDDGRKVELITYLYDTITGIYTQFKKTDNIYDSSGRNISTTKYELDEYEEWFPTQKTEYSYDEQGRRTSSYLYEWNETEKLLEYVEKDLIEYNDNGNHIKYKVYNYNLNTKEWYEVAFSEDFYVEDKLKENIRYSWDGNLNEWVYSVKFEKNYDSNWNEISSNTFRWNIDESSWKKIQKSEKTYYPNGLVESSCGYSLDTAGQWIGSTKHEYIYNEFEEIISTIQSYWDYEKNDWKYTYKFVKEYNLNHQLVTDLTYNWDDAGEEWLITRKKTFEYDIYRHNIKVSNYGYRNEIWELDIKEEYFYSQLTTNTNIISQSQPIKLYPNPANETLIIETQNPEITYGKLYDLNGRLMKNLTIQQGVNLFDISDFKSGVYIIQIQQNEGMLVEKLVKN